MPTGPGAGRFDSVVLVSCAVGAFFVGEFTQRVQRREHRYQSRKTADEKDGAKCAFAVYGARVVGARIEIWQGPAEPANGSHGRSQSNVLTAKAGNQAGGHLPHGGFGLLVD